MVSPLHVGERYCPHCGAVVRVPEKTCWLCDEPLAGSGQAGQPVEAQLVPPAPLQFGSSSLLLLLTVISVLLGIARMAPGLAGLLVFLLLPPWLLTLNTSRSRRLRGAEFSTSQKIQYFTLSFFATAAAVAGLAVLLIVAAAIALFAICTGMLDPRWLNLR